MRQIQFQQRHESSWSALEEILDSLESGRNGPKLPPESIRRLPSLYRDVCQHLALAQSRCYSTALIEKLHYLALRAHHQLYKREFRIGKRMLEFMVSDFPVTLRNHHRLFWLAFLLFFGPGILFGAVCYFNPDMIYVVVDDSSVAQMEYMYNPDADHQTGRQEGMGNASRVSMFVFYVYNNTGIGFRTFAGGILFGFYGLLIAIPLAVLGLLVAALLPGAASADSHKVTICHVPRGNPDRTPVFGARLQRAIEILDDDDDRKHPPRRSRHRIDDDDLDWMTLIFGNH